MEKEEVGRRMAAEGDEQSKKKRGGRGNGWDERDDESMTMGVMSYERMGRRNARKTLSLKKTQKREREIIYRRRGGNARGDDRSGGREKV